MDKNEDYKKGYDDAFCKCIEICGTIGMSDIPDTYKLYEAIEAIKKLRELLC